MQDSHPVNFISYFFQLLEVYALHWEYCSALSLGEDDDYSAVCTAKAIDHTLVVNQVCSREEVLDSNCTTSKIFTNVFA